MNTGRRAHRSEVSTVDSALFLAGALTAAAYFQSESEVTTRAPYARIPRLLSRKSRITLMFVG